MKQSTVSLEHDQRATAVAAGIVGNVIEWYDFALYGFMAPILAQVFFSTEDHLISLIATYGIFAIGFVMRPLGSVIFGWLGDTIGRGRTLQISVAMMAIPTLFLGLLPAQAAIGTAAPILLALIRIIQGLSVGGEFSTSVTYLVETAPGDRRGLAGSWANVGSIGGMLLGSAAAAAVTGLISAEALVDWGWRLPFLIGGALGITGLLLRRNLPESKHLARYEAARCRNSPIREAIICNRLEMVQGFAFASGYGSLFYLCLVYLPTWLAEVTEIALADALLANAVAMGLLMPVIPLAGWMSDRWIQRTHLLTGIFLLLGVSGFGFFLWMAQGNGLAMWIGQIFVGLLLAVPMGVAPAIFCELFPEEDRLTGYSIVFNLGLGVVGGLTPMLASWLLLRTGLDIAPALLLVPASLLSVASLLSMRDRSREPLRTSCMTPINDAMKSAESVSARYRAE